jgi:hypothetical protein
VLYDNELFTIFVTCFNVKFSHISILCVEIRIIIIIIIKKTGTKGYTKIK